MCMPPGVKQFLLSTLQGEADSMGSRASERSSRPGPGRIRTSSTEPVLNGSRYFCLLVRLSCSVQNLFLDRCCQLCQCHSSLQQRTPCLATAKPSSPLCELRYVHDVDSRDV